MHSVLDARHNPPTAAMASPLTNRHWACLVKPKQAPTALIIDALDCLERSSHPMHIRNHPLAIPLFYKLALPQESDWKDIGVRFQKMDDKGEIDEFVAKANSVIERVGESAIDEWKSILVKMGNEEEKAAPAKRRMELKVL